MKILFIFLALSASAFADIIELAPGNEATIWPNSTTTVRCSGVQPPVRIKFCTCNYNAYQGNYELRLRLTGTKESQYVTSFREFGGCDSAIKTTASCN